jgi:hypothetical protein
MIELLIIKSSCITPPMSGRKDSSTSNFLNYQIPCVVDISEINGCIGELKLDITAFFPSM